jgi:hypothetical protein
MHLGTGLSRILTTIRRAARSAPGVQTNVEVVDWGYRPREAIRLIGEGVAFPCARGRDQARAIAIERGSNHAIGVSGKRRDQFTRRPPQEPSRVVALSRGRD